MERMVSEEGQRLLQSLNQLVDSERFRKLHWEGTFEEYLSMVARSPRIARTSFQRIYDMIMSYGYEEFFDGKEKLLRYNFYANPPFAKSDAIFGLERSLMNLVQIFRSAAQRYGPERRVILLHGPVGSSKSTIVRLLKRGLEEYSRTDEGGLYSFGWVISDSDPERRATATRQEVKWCPMNEEPLHLIPLELRSKFLRQLNEGKDADHMLFIEGDLCPSCRFTYKDMMKKYLG